MILDVDEATFTTEVVERSRGVPVVVDFWAAWCGPCRALTPVLEKAALEREGRLDLAKVDVDANPSLAQRFGIQGIPAVKAFRDGSVAAEFTGARPLVEVERFMDALLPSEADGLAATGDEASLRAALEADPRHTGAARSLARILLARGEADEALTLLEPVEGDFVAEGLAARARLSGAGEGPRREDLEAAFAAWDAGRPADALEGLQEAIARTRDPEERDLLRQVMVAIFTELGPSDPLSREHRRRLSAALN